MSGTAGGYAVGADTGPSTAPAPTASASAPPAGGYGHGNGVLGTMSEGDLNRGSAAASAHAAPGGAAPASAAPAVPADPKQEFNDAYALIARADYDGHKRRLRILWPTTVIARWHHRRSIGWAKPITLKASILTPL